MADSPARTGPQWRDSIPDATEMIAPDSRRT